MFPLALLHQLGRRCSASSSRGAGLWRSASASHTVSVCSALSPSLSPSTRSCTAFYSSAAVRLAAHRDRDAHADGPTDGPLGPTGHNTTISASISQTETETEVEVEELDLSGRRRFSQLIADTGLLSRRVAERLIRAKRVAVNGAVLTVPSASIDISVGPPVIEVDGVALHSQYPKDLEYPRLWAVMKKKQEIMANNDPQKSRSLLMDRVRNVLLPEVCEKYALKPVYRLDYTVEGLALLTNSGELARMLDSSSSSTTVPINGKKLHDYTRVYRVRVHGLVSDSKLDGLRRGLFIDGKKFQGMNVTVQRKSNTISWLLVTTKDKQPKAIQKCFQAVFIDITRIMCVGFGPYKIDELFPEGSSHGVVELKLDPSINAQYLRYLNARTSRSSVRL